MSLRQEIKQKKPFGSLEEELYLNLQRTADAALRPVAQLLKRQGLSQAQYNVLRILRGTGAEGLPCGEVAHRMVTRDPDVTRLLDRMEKRGLVNRSREREDRRVVVIRITQAGLDVLKGLDAPMARLHRGQMGHLCEKDLRSLIGLLEEARRPPE